MRLDYRAANGQAHTHTFSLGGIKGVEQEVCAFRVDSYAPVLHLDYHLFALSLLPSGAD